MKSSEGSRVQIHTSNTMGLGEGTRDKEGRGMRAVVCVSLGDIAHLAGWLPQRSCQRHLISFCLLKLI